MKRRGPSARRPLAAVLLATFVAWAGAEPLGHVDACFVRPEPALPVEASGVRPAAVESRLGIRRKSGQLFDVELSVVGAGGALCTVAGVARLREAEVLALPVRPEGGKRVASPCLVYLRTLPEALEITTTERACQAQSLCGGQVQLHGQRFELATRVPSTSRSQCFARTGLP